MKTDKLAAMANQIAMYFQSYPREQAMAGVATHINHFWTPRMREALRGQAQAGDKTLDGLVIAAMTRATPAANPAENGMVGDLAHCDAG